MKNHAFIIPVHKQPNLLARSLKILEKENHYFFIHVSGQVKNYDEFVEACKDIKNVVFVGRIPVYHATISQVYATLILLKAAREYGVPFDFFHQISGQDYPLRSNEQFDEYFENTEDSFMCYTFDKDIDYAKREKCISTYSVNTYSNSFIGKCIRHSLNLIGSSFIVTKLFPRSPIDSYAGGWGWFSWSKKVVDFVFQQMETPEPLGRKNLLKRFDHTRAPCEHFFQTILYNHLDDLKIRKHYPLRYISWRAHRPVETAYRPFNLNEQDYDFIINSPTFFC